MKFVKYLGAFIGILVVLLTLAFLFYNESRPKIKEGGNAEAMAQKMLSAVDKAAWDTLPYIKWTFAGEHHYIWDKTKNDAIVKWGDTEVHLDPDEVTGRALTAGQNLEGEAAQKAIQTAWSYWCNDMFWLAAPYKIKDPGVTLDVATDSDGNEGLLATYASGGVTPGDSYLWFLDDKGLPTGYKMWVKIIPMGGIYVSWTDWKTMPGGANIATMHQAKVESLKIPITNLAAGNSWSDLGFDASPIKL